MIALAGNKSDLAQKRMVEYEVSSDDLNHNQQFKFVSMFLIENCDEEPMIIR